MGLTVFAPAKVNLFLEVLRRRADGYHEIETVMHAVDLGDELEFARADRIELVCDAPQVPVGGDNLVVKAAQLLREAAQTKAGARIRLYKRIPIGAGLGGGSSDAAAALVGLNALWGLGMDRDQLAELAGRVGSDVPFFIYGGTALCRGRGEKVTPIQCPARLHFVLLLPRVLVSTARVYENLTLRLTIPPKPGTFNRLAVESGDISAIAAALFNRLEETTFALYPELADWKAKLAPHPFLGMLMSGSGSCLYGLCKNAAQAQRLAREVDDGSATCVVAASYRHTQQDGLE